VTALVAAAPCASPCTAGAASPAGWDAYRRLDLLPMLRAGEQARLASSHDRRGGNADGGRYACRRVAAGRCVIAEHTGPGEVDSIWTTRPRAGDVRRTGTIRVELDGRRVLDDPLTSVVAGRLGAPFRFPAVASARQASGAVWIKVPLAFRERMLITTSRNPGYVRVNYRTFPDSDGIATFDPADPADDVFATLRASGRRDPKRPGAAGAAVSRPGARMSGPATMSGTGGPAKVSGAGTITGVRVRLDGGPTATALARGRLRMTFDGRRTVDAPLGELFGSGLPGRVRSLMAAHEGGVLTMWWPMPFRESAAIGLAGARGSVSATLSRDPGLPAALGRGEAGYFRATSRAGATVPGRPWRVLEASGAGLLVGISATLRGPASQRHLEGDETIVADGRALRGTGTEDLFEGGFYWHFGTRSLPLVGSPARRGRTRSMYRWLIPDAVPFSRRLTFTLEHGDRNRDAGRYSTTALWYAP
jgi:D-arabinan exo alpha-(1,3)/(1,5)-arabinofuranosidase (non-reducing end)